MKVPNANHFKAISFISENLVKRGSTPSVRELMKELGYKSSRSAQVIIQELDEFGFITKYPGGDYRLITDTLDHTKKTSTINVPIVGSAPCGKPMLAEENIDGYIQVTTDLAKPPHKYFLLHAKGDSMNQAGISDGNLVLIKQQNTANPGERVVALINNEATIKIFQPGSDVILLKPKSSNPTHMPIICSQNITILGIVESVINNL